MGNVARTARVAFFVGGVVAGATARARSAGDSALQGVLTWGLAVVALLGLSVLGSGFAAGAIGEVTEQFDIEVGTVDDVDTTQVAGDVQDASGVALLSMSLALVAAAGGALVGARMGPADRREIDLRNRRTTGTGPS